ncbi:transmembrane protein 130-like [Tetranychus urticae]|uniref:transmembrane protein 130-like n=1 Tax=Tetranychus urticae TaxID=32264 RepID=UPI00077BC875|nr:transmembrane protein 130-like [Tetranychus urticae]
MRSLLSFFILCFVSFINEISCDWIEMYDDGPVTFDAPITFTFKYKYGTDVPALEYRFKFDQFPQHDKTIVSTEREVVYPVIFESSSTLKAGNYTVQVDVWECPFGVPSHSIKTVLHTFKLTDSLIGSIHKNQDIYHESPIFTLQHSENNIAFTVMPVKLTAEIRDPKGYFSGKFGNSPANMTYRWIINDEPQEENNNVIQHTFYKPQLNNISVIVTATKTNGSDLIQKSGTFSTTLISKDPITNLTVDGPTEVKVFERLHLDFKIHRGTPPFQYDYSFFMEKPYIYESVARGTNETSFSIVHYFSEKGIRNFHINVKNDVNNFGKSLIITVY